MNTIDSSIGSENYYKIADQENDTARNFKLKNSVEALKWWEMAFERNNLNMNLKQKIEDKRYYDEK